MNLAGLGRLIRLIIRRERLKLPLWIIGIGSFHAIAIFSVAEIYGQPAERLAYATASSASLLSRAFNGPVIGSSMGSISLTESFTFFTILVGLMTTLLVVRHTRANEEQGLGELVGAGSVGRFAPLVASLVVASGANFIIGAIMSLVYFSSGLEAEGSILAGVAMALVGVTFAGVAAVATQLTFSARAANGIAASCVGLAFLVRAVGDAMGEVQPGGVDVRSGWLSWLSPMGIARNSRPFVDNDWSVVGILLGIIVVVGGMAFWLQSRRDLGGALFAERRGPARAHATLLSPLGLAWRLQRGLLLGWAIGLVVLGVTFGGVSREVDAIASGSEEMREIVAALGGAQNLTDAYLSFSLLFICIMVAGYVIQALLRLRSEEVDGRFGILLATPTHRWQWVLSHMACVTLGAAVLLCLSGGAGGLAYGLTIGDTAVQTGRMTLAGLIYLPVVMIFAGVVLALYGLRAQWAMTLSWLMFLASCLLTQFAELFKLPDWVRDLSPFAHAPSPMTNDIELLLITMMMLVAGGLMVLGIFALQRRDVTD